MRKELLHHARQVGFNEVDEEEVDNLITSHETDLSTEELLQMQTEREEETERERGQDTEKKDEEMKQITSKDLARMFACIDEAMQIMEDKDPQQERVCRVQQNIRQSLRCYYEMQRNFRAMAKQRTIEGYFKQPQPSTSEPQPSTSEPQPSASEPQPSTPQKSPRKARQMTLYESLTLKTSFAGFDDESEDELPDLAAQESASDHE